MEDKPDLAGETELGKTVPPSWDSPHLIAVDLLIYLFIYFLSFFLSFFSFFRQHSLFREAVNVISLFYPSAIIM